MSMGKLMAGRCILQRSTDLASLEGFLGVSTVPLLSSLTSRIVGWIQDTDCRHWCCEAVRLCCKGASLFAMGPATGRMRSVADTAVCSW